MKQAAKILLTVLLFVFLSGCSSMYGDLKEGDCKGRIMLEEFPKEFSFLDEEVRDTLEIQVVMWNPITDKHYKVTLNKKNSYCAEISLHPGEYQIQNCYQNIERIAPFTVEAGQDSIYLNREQGAELEIYIKDTEEYTAWKANVQPDSAILAADKFSRTLQLDGAIVSFGELVDRIEFSYDKQVAPYEKIMLNNPRYGITVTLQNQSKESTNWKNCEVVGVRLFKNMTILAGGITVGKSLTDVCHAKTGIFGIPAYFTGTIFMGTGYEETKAVYLDSISGDKITLTYPPNNKYVTDILYEFSIYE